MKLYLLEYFLKVAELESITQAAEELHLHQPTLSKAIIQLEEQLGVPLFDRTGRNLHLNSAGRQFLVHAKFMLEEWNSTVENMKSVAKEQREQINLSVFYSCNTFLMPAFLPRFIERHPSYSLYIDRGYSEKIFADVLSGRAQAGIVVGSAKNPRLRQIPLYEEEFVFLVPRNHPWYKLDTIPREELSKSKIITPCMEETYKDYMQPLRRGIGDTPLDISYSIHGHDAARRMIVGGVNYPAIVPRTGCIFWDHEFKDDRLRLLGMSEPVTRVLTWIECSDRHHSSLTDIFFQEFTDFLSQQTCIKPLFNDM